MVIGCRALMSLSQAIHDLGASAQQAWDFRGPAQAALRMACRELAG